MKPYAKPGVTSARHLLPHHVTELAGSAVDFQAAALAGLYSIDHAEAFDKGVRSRGRLDGLAFSYWDPQTSTFSKRLIRVKPDIMVAGRKYLQPCGEQARLYFIPGTSLADLEDSTLPVFLVEGEKKCLSVDRALRRLNIPGLVIGLGGVWNWRHSPKELKPDGKLDKGRSVPIEELDTITWKGRNIYVILDSDVLTNPKVESAERCLARELDGRGANVFIVRVDGGGHWKKSA